MEEDALQARGNLPDLLLPPHMLPVLMELFAGSGQKAISERELLIEHLAVCQYCRTAVVALLGIAQEYDRRNGLSEEPTQNLLMDFASLSQSIDADEARNYERIGAYAEAVVAEGQERAALRFPVLAAHLRTCSECRLRTEETIAAIHSDGRNESAPSVDHPLRPT